MGYTRRLLLDEMLREQDRSEESLAFMVAALTGIYRPPHQKRQTTMPESFAKAADSASSIAARVAPKPPVND